MITPLKVHVMIYYIIEFILYQGNIYYILDSGDGVGSFYYLPSHTLDAACGKLKCVYVALIGSFLQCLLTI